MSVIELTPKPLTRDAFAPFGDVIEVAGADSFLINQGTTTRFHDLAAIDVGENDGRPVISIFRGAPRSSPIIIQMMERHPVASQAFFPLAARPYLVVVAEAGAAPSVDRLHAFIAGDNQGVNYHRGVWHHPLLALQAESDFLIIDRGGIGDNLDEHRFEDTHAHIDLPDRLSLQPTVPEKRP